MKSNVVKRLLKYIGKHRRFVLGALLCAVFSNILMIAGPFIIGKGVDNIVGKGRVDFKQILNIVVIIIILYLVSAVFQWSLQVLTSKLANRTVEGLRNDVFTHVTQMPLEYYDRNAHGDIMARLTSDMEYISEGIFQSVTQFVTGIISIVGSLVFMFILNPFITLVVIVMTPITFFIASFITKRSSSLFKEQSRLNGELNGFVEEMVGNQKVVKAFNYEDRAREKFEEINGRLYKAGRWAQFYSSLVNPSTRLVNNITYVLLGLTGGIAAIAGRLSVGYISSFLTYSTYFSQPINNITSVTTQLQTAAASAQRVFAVLDSEPEKPEAQGLVEFTSSEGKVSFDRVDFSYNPETRLIKDFSLNVKPGTRIAIVGPTGAGKTTLVNLLMRFYEVDSGNIYIDDINSREMTKDSLRKSFGMVLQETWLFSGTIRENIAYGKPDATDEEIIAAAKSSNAHSFIKRLPAGYNTMVAEGGGNLSQGQRQLLTIARVMLIIPPMLILDEATSSVDTRTEIKIQNAFNKLMEGRTSFIIAHRLSTIREADLILVLNNGQIVEQGNHEQLLEKGGFYSKLYYSQYENED
ncbi:ABC transporter ATP-binding protein [Ruminiclostridium cellobioparum]|uniref:ABC transporter, ATP-binding protein n=1 Tax=Ruminiclostridium cellobioparum subsp. termitidis CT1112 TaxID=1195236 RepID=S0FLP6_RUMCE|nr:ABC transporter ATP-binding protein [Ruminiclostridium cellobioparum]EMS69388.1 ABC transporter, ATP-binding protein [Ruminiclostridium cellobioparum subsp. termitidis CT1112]